jgi:DNA repair protein RecN (Recombination protein N)
MLSRLRVKDYAIIDSVEVSFSSGLNVVTGETGAGKSILVDALCCALGARVSGQVVKPPSDGAHIDAVFSLPQAYRLANGSSPYFDCDGDDKELVLSRSISSSGKTRAWANGRPSPVGFLREAAGGLIEVEKEDLRGEGNFGALAILDAWGKREISPVASKVADAYSSLDSLRSQLSSLTHDPGELVRRVDAARFELSEIAAAALSPGEDEDLAHRKSVLANAELIAEAAGSALAELAGDESGAQDAVARARRALEGVSKYDTRLAETTTRLDQIDSSLCEAASDLRASLESLDRSPQALEDVISRIDLVARLKRKYGGSIADVLEYAVGLREKLNELEDRDRKVEELTRELATRQAQLEQLSAELSAARRAASVSLIAEVKGQLEGLNFPRSDFAVEFDKKPLGPNGGDKSWFVISLNPGQPMLPLEEVASLGESSRIMLAVRCAFARARSPGTVVFDEVDVGLGGMTAHCVAQKLKALSEHSQVICVTHLTQIARVADHHLKVEKRVRKNRTDVLVSELDAAGKSDELKRMEGKPHERKAGAGDARD